MARTEPMVPKLVTVWREGFTLPQVRADLLAGLTVAIVALPLSMALGIASGASPDKGLVTAIVAGFLISALGGSRVQVGGPTGAFVVVIAGVIARHGYGGLIAATLLAGVILIVAGYAGVGRLMRYVPMPVITGFTSGIAVIIATGEIGDFFGLSVHPVPADVAGKWLAWGRALPMLSLPALGVGLGTLALILALRRLNPRLPGYLIALAAAAAVVALGHLPVETVGQRFPHMPTTLPLPALPALDLATLRDVFPSALTIAFLGGIEALLSAVVADGMTGYHHRSGQELVGQGWANLASALFGGLPATGAIARTATNIRAGARTPLAGMAHAAFLLLILLVAGRLVAYVPMPALAAILLIVAWGMSEVDHFAQLLRTDPGERAILLLTFALTVLVDLTVAIGVGVTLASLVFMARMSDAASVLDEHASLEDPAQRAALPPGVEVCRIAGPMFFGAAQEMLEALVKVGQRPHTLIVRLDRVPYIDASGLNALATFTRRARAAHTRVILCEAQSGVWQSLARTRPRFVGAERVRSLRAALARAAVRRVG